MKNTALLTQQCSIVPNNKLITSVLCLAQVTGYSCWAEAAAGAAVHMQHVPPYTLAVYSAHADAGIMHTMHTMMLVCISLHSQAADITSNQGFSITGSVLRMTGSIHKLTTACNVIGMQGHCFTA